MEGRDLKAGLREAEELYASQAPSADAELRMRERLLRPKRSGGLRWLVVVGAAAALAAVAFGVWRGRGPARLGEFELSYPSDDLRASVDGDRTVRIVAGRCELFDPLEGERLSVAEALRVRKEPTGLRVLSGAVTFSVAKRAKGTAPARILVSHGAIEVLGTRFTIHQEETSGSVTLFEGTIRFTADDGRTRTLEGKGELSWPLAPDAPPAPPREPAPSEEPAPKRPPLTYADAEELLERVDGLRSRGQYEEAVRYLETALKSELHATTRERFSYELGAILTYQLSDASRACPYWWRHRREYHGGSYSPEVNKAMQHLRCGEQR